MFLFSLALYLIFCIQTSSLLPTSSDPIRSTPFGPPSPSRLGIYRKAAVSSDGVPCSTVGKEVLAEGGNAVDSAIATLFCIGVANPHSAGLGGGFFMTIYDPKKKRAVCLNARERAPSAATPNMFKGSDTASIYGALSVAVPGQLAGYWAAHQRFGKLNWSRLVLPAAKLAENGLPVNQDMAFALKYESDVLKQYPSMKLFLNQTTGEVLKKGDIYRMPALAATLRSIAANGVGIFYNGSIGRQFVEDVRKLGGILKQKDLLNYKIEWVDPIRVYLKGNFTLFSMPPPGGGLLLAMIMKILDGLNIDKLGSANPLSYHRMLEAMKHAFGQRTKLGDPNFVPGMTKLAKKLISEGWIKQTRAKINDFVTFNDPKYYGAFTYQINDHGTSHVSILDEQGMAVSATSTINLYFGAHFISEQTGIIPNDEMDDFSTPGLVNAYGVPPSPANFIRPGKQPLSSMSPTVVIRKDTGKVRLIVGAEGGTAITTSNAYVAIRNLWFNENIKEAMDCPRIHHQLFPMSFWNEPGFPDYIIKNLTAKGHRRTPQNSDVGPANVCGVSTTSDGLIQANSDYRKGGDVDGIDPVTS